MTPREDLVARVENLIGSNALVWCGLRGDDARSLADLSQFAAAFSIVSRYAGRPGVEALALEDLSGERPDLELWNIEDHLEDGSVASFRECILRQLSGDAVLMPYRPSEFISSIVFSRRGNCRDLGRFGGLQGAFEHKPWAETSLADLGVRTLRWAYLVDPSQLNGLKIGPENPVVVRPSRTSGGNGLLLCERAEDIINSWPAGPDGLVSVAPYMANALPVNVGAVVWHGGVTVHHASVQLIGVEPAVERPFGYAGSDFGRAKYIDATALDDVEQIVREVGGWLGRFGYRGAFGVDLLVTDNEASFVEVNPRFQGSTALSCLMDSEAGEPCLMIEHLAATLGVSYPTTSKSLRKIAESQPERATVIVHHRGPTAALVDPVALRAAAKKPETMIELEVVPETNVKVQPGAVITRLTTDTVVSDDGYQLRDGWSDVVEQIQCSVRPTICCDKER